MADGAAFERAPRSAPPLGESAHDAAPNASDQSAATPQPLGEPSGRPSTRRSGQTRSLVAWGMRLPRTLAALPTAFGLFCFSSMLPTDGACQPGPSDLYPCPLPFPWSCGKPPRGGHARARWAKSWARKFWVNACVAALNYFALGLPRWCPPGARHGGRQSAAQAAMVRSVAARCKSMLREPLSWACGKVLHAHDTSRLVAELMRRAELEGATYYQRTDRTLGDLGAGASPARHLVAERVALPSSPPFFDPGLTWKPPEHRGPRRFITTRPSVSSRPAPTRVSVPSSAAAASLVQAAHAS